MEQPDVALETDPQAWTSLTHVLQRKISPGAIATAIEEEGVWGWDRFGRFKKFEKSTDEFNKALNLVADVYAYESVEYRPNDDVPHPLDACAGSPDNPFELYGWRTESLPEFKDAPDTLAPHRPQRNSAVTKERDSLLVIIGALLKKCGIQLGQTDTVRQVKDAIELAGARMDHETIGRHLAKIDEAIDRRSK